MENLDVSLYGQDEKENRSLGREALAYTFDLCNLVPFICSAVFMNKPFQFFLSSCHF